MPVWPLNPYRQLNQKGKSMADEITKNLPDGVNTWFAAPAPTDATPDIILENNGTLRIYTKNRILAQNLVLQAKVMDLGKELKIAEGDGGVVPSTNQITGSNRRDWFKGDNELFEIIITEGTKKALSYEKIAGN